MHPLLCDKVENCVETLVELTAPNKNRIDTCEMTELIKAKRSLEKVLDLQSHTTKLVSLQQIIEILVPEYGTSITHVLKAKMKAQTDVSTPAFVTMVGGVCTGVYSDLKSAVRAGRAAHGDDFCVTEWRVDAPAIEEGYCAVVFPVDK